MRSAEFVESYIDAWNHRDSQGVADHLTADGVYRDIPINEQRTQEELITTLGEFFAKYRHRYELVGEVLSGEDTIAYQYRIYPMAGNNADVTSNIYHGAEFMTLNGDAAIKITDYYDIPGLGTTPPIAKLATEEARQNKYAKSGLTSEQLQQYKVRLDHIMIAGQAFLQPDLTLPRLAKAVDCSVNHLSQVINAGFGMSFFDYLNQHRIAHAKVLLTQSDDNNGAILNVAFTVGFNSNSAFYAAFKKCVGQTPAQYRRRQLRQLS